MLTYCDLVTPYGVIYGVVELGLLILTWHNRQAITWTNAD